MTGFGAADGEVGGTRVSIEVRSVNHRFFNPSIKLPSELTKWEAEVREALRRGIARGHVSLTARVENALSRKYQSVYGYDAPGAVVLVGARLSAR